MFWNSFQRTWHLSLRPSGIVPISTNYVRFPTLDFLPKWQSVINLTFLLWGRTGEGNDTCSGGGEIIIDKYVFWAWRTTLKDALTLSSSRASAKTWHSSLWKPHMMIRITIIVVVCWLKAQKSCLLVHQRLSYSISIYYHRK